MATKKISELSAAGALAGTEQVPVVQGGETVRTTTQDIANKVSTIGAFSSGAHTPTTDAVSDIGDTSHRWTGFWLAVGGFLDWASSAVRITHATDLLTVSGATWRFAAGTATRAPAKLQSGTLLTTAEAGALEYDGVASYLTSVASSRQVVVAEQFVALTADRAGTDVNTAQAVFDTNDTITLAASTSYRFEAQYWITRAAGTTSHTTATLFGGTATFTSITYLAQITNPTGNALANVQQIMTEAATAVTLTAANTSATENLMIRLTGIMRISAGGTVIPQFQFSAAPGGAPTIEKNSFFRCWPLGSDSVASVGNWS